MLDEKLACIAGRVEGQTLHIETRRCERVDVLISDAPLNPDQPVTVMMDGTDRFQDKLERRIDVLLEDARTHWEFQHSIAARIQVPGAARGDIHR